MESGDLFIAESRRVTATLAWPFPCRSSHQTPIHVVGVIRNFHRRICLGLKVPNKCWPSLLKGLLVLTGLLAKL